ncbi:ABC transporter permease [Salipaludibacillus neizhouensis]|uniref:ABC transporter permease n=2 Tax=Salipaludibacillus neizhouensis TaxID=885475 RepID=A0A3A9JVE6_9BACI|nr:ABC transporter permease [Salipaludibacillus neizhouensis]
MAMSRGEKILQVIIVTTLCLLSIIAIIPVVSVLATSFSSRLPVDMNQVTLWPIGFTFDSWKYMIFRPDLWKSFGITLFTTIIGTILSLLITALMAYPLAKKEFMLGKFLIIAAVITLVLKPPLVPYFLTLREYGLYNNILVLIFPHVLTAFNLIIMRTFFKDFPQELEEAAKVEGCGYFRVFFQLVLPLSKPVLATLGLFYAVVIWNQFQHPVMFIQDPDLFPLQLKIRQFITSESVMPALMAEERPNYNEYTLRATAIIFAITPIIMVYPFIQKYFVKGAMLGAVKD